MAVGKRLRFQIFRRDNFACRYCGRAAQDGAVLEVDHIKPRAEGGADDPTNLVTACEGCNSGKSDIPLHLVMVADVPQADFQAAMAARDADDDDDPRITAATAWFSGFTSWIDHRIVGKFCISESFAWACGYKAEDIIAACYEAGSFQEPELRWYLPEQKWDDDGHHEQLHYEMDLVYLDRFASHELCPIIRQAEQLRKDASQPTMHFQHAVRLVASLVRKWEEGELARHPEGDKEEGRDHEALKKWLRELPRDQGSWYIARATAEWDAYNRGKDPAINCPAEILENAVALALSEVPKTIYCSPCLGREHEGCVGRCDCEHPGPVIAEQAVEAERVRKS